jgi:hypothetical protein
LGISGLPIVPDLFVLSQHPRFRAAVEKDHDVAIDPIEEEKKERDKVDEKQKHEEDARRYQGDFSIMNVMASSERASE